MKSLCSKCNQYGPMHKQFKERCTTCCQLNETNSANGLAKQRKGYAIKMFKKREEQKLREIKTNGK